MHQSGTRIRCSGQATAGGRLRSERARRSPDAKRSKSRNDLSRKGAPDSHGTRYQAAVLGKGKKTQQQMVSTYDLFCTITL